MMICDVMCSAESEYVIYFLLAAYLESTHFGGRLPEWLTKLPLGGLRNVEARFQSMMACKAKFAWPSARSDDQARAVMQEAIQIFETAFFRLNFLKHMRAAAFVAGSAAAGRLPVTQGLHIKQDPPMQQPGVRAGE
jgi:hypothetical protein